MILRRQACWSRPTVMAQAVTTKSPRPLNFVGTGNKEATEYHSSDFDFDEHLRRCAPLLEEQLAQAAALRKQRQEQQRQQATSRSGGSNTDVHCAAAEEQDENGQPRKLSARARRRLRNSERRRTAACAGAVAAINARGTSADCSSSGIGGGNGGGKGLNAALDAGWEQFFRANATARAWRERRYLSLAFPSLAPQQQQQHFYEEEKDGKGGSSSSRSSSLNGGNGRPLEHIVEIGAGCGSSILPLLKLHPHARATVSDVSGTSLRQLLAAAAADGIDTSPTSGRIKAFVADGTDPQLAAKLASDPADACLLMFTLSAVPPGAPMAAMMANAAASLKPGGALCLRDSGLGDMVQLRIPPEQLLLLDEDEEAAETEHGSSSSSSNTLDAFVRGRVYYRRGDGTMACYFSREWLAALGAAAGLAPRSVEYATVINRNRRTGQELRRVFAQAEFVKPL